MCKKILYAFLFLNISFYLYSGPNKNPILKVETENHTTRINRISTDANNRYIVTFSGDKTARVWDYNGRLLKVLRPPIGEGHEGKLFSGAISPDGKIVVCGGWTGYEWDKTNSIYVFDRETGKMIRRVSNIPGVINDINFSKDGKYIAIAMGSGYGIRVYNTSDFTLYGEDKEYSESSYSVVFHEKYLAATAYDDYLRVYDISRGFKLIDKVKTQTGNRGSFYLSFSPDGKYIALTHSTKTLELYSFNGRKLNFVSFIDNPNVPYNDWFSGVTFSGDGKYIYAGGSYQKYINGDWKRIIVKYDLNGKVIKEIPAAADLVISIKSINNNRVLFASCEPSFGVIDSDTDNIVMFKSSSIPDLRGPFEYFLVSYDGSEICFNIKWSKETMIFSLVNRDYKEYKGARTDLTPPDMTSLSINNWKFTYSMAEINGNKIEIERGERSMSLAIMPDRSSFIIGGDFNLYKFDLSGKIVWKTPIQGVAWTVNVSGDGRFVLAGLADGTIRWYRSSDGKEVLALFPSPDKKRWVVWSPSGYYDSSIGGDELIGWHINNGDAMESDFFPASRFRTRFYRPDIIAKILEKGDEAIAVKESSKERLKELVNKALDNESVDILVPPVVNIVEPYDGFETSDNMITIKYSVRSPNGEPITGIRVLVDGRPVSITKGLSIVPKSKNSEEIKEVVVNIPEKDCEVSLIAENKFSASQPSTVRIKWKGKEEFVIKPKLYVLAIGVSKYESSDINKLEFAAKDAKDFAESLLSQKGTIYRDVSIKVLVDKDATKDNILDALEWIQKETTSKDVAMIFISGHGVNDPTGIYYFLPVNANLEKLKRTGVPFSDIKNTAVAIPGKVIMFIDTCHSGNIMGTRRGLGDMNSVINELASAENGLVVFTSSTGSQYSLEDPKWGNGAFTRALIEGLSGKADYTGKGKITINMLDLYISERVKELTKGAQTPTSIKPATVPDFPIALIKRR